MERTDTQSARERARTRARYLSGLLWHVGVFLIINAFFWFLDLGLGDGGPNWAFWITIVWGMALAFHALGFVIDGRQLEERKTQQYLDEERQRETRQG